MLFASGQDSTRSAPPGRVPSTTRIYKYDICGLPVFNIHLLQNNFFALWLIKTTKYTFLHNKFTKSLTIKKNTNSFSIGETCRSSIHITNMARYNWSSPLNQ